MTTTQPEYMRKLEDFWRRKDDAGFYELTDIIDQIREETKKEYLEDYLYGMQKMQGILSRSGREDGEGGEISAITNAKATVQQMIHELQIAIKGLNPDRT